MRFKIKLITKPNREPCCLCRGPRHRLVGPIGFTKGRPVCANCLRQSDLKTYYELLKMERQFIPDDSELIKAARASGVESLTAGAMEYARESALVLGMFNAGLLEAPPSMNTHLK